MRPSGRWAGAADDDDDEHLLEKRERERAMKWALNIQDAAAESAAMAMARRRFPLSPSAVAVIAIMGEEEEDVSCQRELK